MTKRSTRAIRCGIPSFLSVMYELEGARPRYPEDGPIRPVIDVHVPENYDKAAMKRLKKALGIKGCEFIKI